MNFAFEHRFACELLDEFPAGLAPRYMFPSKGASGQDGLIVRMLPEDRRVWIGVFAFGRFGSQGLSNISSTPDPYKVCVVATGAGYIVNTRDPRDWEAVASVPIIDVVSAQTARLIIFADYTELVAYGEDGMKWRTKRLALDGLRIIEVGECTLVGEYEDLRSESVQRFEVDLLTGSSRGGIDG